jgi:hypothetical protein
MTWASVIFTGPFARAGVLVAFAAFGDFAGDLAGDFAVLRGATVLGAGMGASSDPGTLPGRLSSPPVPTVELTNHLHQFFPALRGKALRVEARTVAEVVRALEAMAPGFAFYVCDETGRLRQHVNIFVGDERIKDRGTLGDALAPDARVSILQALSGG